MGKQRRIQKRRRGGGEGRGGVKVGFTLKHKLVPVARRGRKRDTSEAGEVSEEGNNSREAPLSRLGRGGLVSKGRNLLYRALFAGLREMCRSTGSQSKGSRLRERGGEKPCLIQKSPLSPFQREEGRPLGEKRFEEREDKTTTRKKIFDKTLVQRKKRGDIY